MKIPEVYLIEVEHMPGNLARVLQVVGSKGLIIEGLQAVERTQQKTIWEITLEFDESVNDDLLEAINALPIAHVLGRSDRVMNRHIGGKIHTVGKSLIGSWQALRDMYTPGVARVCLAIYDDPALARKYTNINRTVAIITDGTAVLGLGDIGALAGLPVMEGKAALFAQLADISGVPILLEHSTPDQIVETVQRIAPSFGAIQLEDIAAPACFDIERRLCDSLDIPVLHDDQHGTAVVTLAALLSATRQVGVDLGHSVVGHIGLGAAGIGITRLLLSYGVKRMLGADLSEDSLQRFEAQGGERSTLGDLMKTCDIVVATTGVRGLIKPEMVRPGQMILALTNPDPEIEPAVALRHGARFAADGKNVNNVLAFPGLFRGVLDAGAKHFTEAMLVAAAECLSKLATGEHLIPDALDRSVHDAVAIAVAAAALEPAAVMA
jgi:malate dehydrogenase (oxaloacetate-decarboxylating)